MWYRFCTMLTAIVLAGCRSISNSDAKLEVRLATDRTVIQLGQATTVEVTVTNRGNDPINLNVGPCPPRFVVLNVQGEIVGPRTDQPCSAILSMRTLTLGESFAFRYVWRGEGRTKGSQAPIMLPPGIYRLRPDVLSVSQTFVGQPVEIRVEPANGN